MNILALAQPYSQAVRDRKGVHGNIHTNCATELRATVAAWIKFPKAFSKAFAQTNS